MKNNNVKSRTKSILKQFIREGLFVFGKIVKPFYRLLSKKLYVIVNIEGGIACQLEQYTMGQLIARMGYSVAYDLSSYLDGHSMDVLGNSERNLDIGKLDKNVHICEANSKTLKLYKLLFSYSKKKEDCKKLTSATKLRCPIYLDGYGYGFYSEKRFEEEYRLSIRIDYDLNEFGDDNTKILDEIKSHNEAIGMHIRRGDTLLPKVGRPIPKAEYYLKALSYFSGKLPIYIFTDDPTWSQDVLLPCIPNNARCKIVRNNGSDRGWCDLILLANCKNIIKSPTGGMGREAFRLNQNEDKKLILPVFVPGNNCEMTGNIQEILLNDELCDMKFVKDFDIRL